MATESPIRMIEARQKWPTHKVATPYVSSSASTLVDEACQMHSGSTVVPNRSGSAPPSVEGSIAAIGNLMQSSGFNHHSLSHVPGGSSNWRSASFDGSCYNSLHPSRGILPTHKEESEDDKSPQQPSVDRTERSSTVLSMQESSSLVARNRSLVQLTREDLSRTSLVYDQSQSSHHALVGEVANHDINVVSQHVQAVGESNAAASIIQMDDAISASDTDVSASTSSGSRSHDGKAGRLPTLHKGGESCLDAHSAEDTSVNDDSGIDRIQSSVKALKISHPPDVGNQKGREDRRSVFPNDVDQHQTQHQTNVQFRRSTPQIASQGLGNSYAQIDQGSHGGKLSLMEVQPVLQSSGFNPPLYAASAYMHSANPYYSTIQTPGVMYSAEYGIGGYAFNGAVLPPFLAGYSPHNTPLYFDGAGTHNYNIRTSGVSSGAAMDMQEVNKFYGQLGVVQPPFVDPRMQSHPPFPDVYNASGQADSLALKGGVMGAQVSSFNSQGGHHFAAFLPDYGSKHQTTGGPTNVMQRRGGMTNPNYFGSPTSMGSFVHIPSSTPRGPVLPAPVIPGDVLSGGRNEPIFSPNSSRNSRLYANGPGQRTLEIFNCPKTYSILEELKSGKGRRFELSNIAGHVAELSVDQHGSRFIQQKLEHCSIEEKTSVFNEVLPHASKLMTDVFGNYVIQKFFEYGTPEQRKELANKLTGQILSLSLQMYGCRVIQKALDAIELDQKAELVRELDGHVMRCVRDQNGNHVIQKCIESIPIEKMDFIIYAFRGQVAALSMHPYGCRVIQRALERCTDEVQCQFLVDEILESVCTLAQDQYGNYVTQHVLEKEKPNERSQIIKKLSGQIVQMSQHKFASNVVEKCLEYGDAAGRELLIGEIIGKDEGNDNLLIMMKDQYANYVVQKTLEKCTENQRDLLLGRVRGHLHALKKYTYGKHIVSRFEQLFGEEIQASGS
ncbi:hypothetical protein Dimus_025696 [Dionaea muscipula]